MGNSFFKFKTFTINQDRCAMKVCTDSCLFGAIIPVRDTDVVLDIGTGTGLLSLMQTHKNSNIRIDAIEIDEDAFSQAKENVALANQQERINVYHTALQDYTIDKKYTLIISNPPFYENSLQHTNHSNNIARHSISLNKEELLKHVSRLLDVDGLFYVLLPESEGKIFIEMAQGIGLYLMEQILIRDRPNLPHIRRILCFTNKQIFERSLEKEMIIRDMENQYTLEFKAHLKDYYLYL